MAALTRDVIAAGLGGTGATTTPAFVCAPRAPGPMRFDLPPFRADRPARAA